MHGSVRRTAGDDMDELELQKVEFEPADIVDIADGVRIAGGVVG